MLKSEPKNLVLVAGDGIRMSRSLSVPYYNFSMEWTVHQQGYVGDLDMYEERKRKRKRGKILSRGIC